MDQIINNQFNVSPSRGSSPHFDRSFFCFLSTLEVWYDPSGCSLSFSKPQETFSKSIATDPVKIGLASLKPTLTPQIQHTLHFIDYAPKPLRAPLYKRCLSFFALLTLLIAPIFTLSLRFGAIYLTTASIFQPSSMQRRPFFCTFLLFPLDNEMLMLFGHERHAVNISQRQPWQPCCKDEEN